MQMPMGGICQCPHGHTVARGQGTTLSITVGLGCPWAWGGGARAQPPPQKPVAHHHAPGCGGQREAHGTLLGVLLAPPHLAWLMGLGCRVGFGSGLKSELGFRIGTRGWGPG